jgi:dipeptidyl-peptidase III
MSNYHSFGDIKFVPDLPSFEIFSRILYSHPDITKGGNLKSVLDQLLPQVDKEVFNRDKPYTQLNFPHEGGVTGYFSRNMTSEDLKLVKEVLMSEKVDILNTRAFKKDNGEIVITVGSIEQSTRKVEFAGHTFEIKFGEFASYLKDINYYLERALPYCANET